MTKTRIIFSQRLAGYLMFNGFILLKMAKDKKNPNGRNIFFFPDTSELHVKVREYLELHKEEVV